MTNLAYQFRQVMQEDTFLCHTTLIDNFLRIDGHDFALTAQSDHMERRFRQYRQISGGRFLVSLKEWLDINNKNNRKYRI